MLNTYKATLKGNRLEWGRDIPKIISLGKAVEVFVTILDESVASPSVSQGQRMAAALERLAAIDALAEVTEPAKWEREIRQDRILPDRENDAHYAFIPA